MALRRAVPFMTIGLGEQVAPGDNSVVTALLLIEGRTCVFQVRIDFVLKVPSRENLIGRPISVALIGTIVGDG